MMTVGGAPVVPVPPPYEGPLRDAVGYRDNLTITKAPMPPTLAPTRRWARLRALAARLFGRPTHPHPAAPGPGP